MKMLHETQSKADPQESILNLVEAWQSYKSSTYRDTPCLSNRASQLGGDCERQLVYWRTQWEDAVHPSLGTQILLQEGEKHERQLLMELQLAGVEVIEQQASLSWRAFQITGHVDAVVVHDGESVPVDVKSMSPHIFSSSFPGGSGVYQWREVEEAFSQRPWLRKYLAQITLYALMKSTDRGLLLCLNKGTGELAQVDVPLDYEFAEGLLRKAERINEHVRAGSLPDRMRFDESVCPKCPFYTTCLPEHVGKDPIAFLEDETVEWLLDERENFRRDASAFRKADERVKAWAKARPEDRMTVGRWLIMKRSMKRGVRVDVFRLGEGEGVLARR